MAYMQNAQLGDLGKFSLKKIGKKLGKVAKKVVKVALPVVGAVGGGILGAKAGKALTKKKKKKQAIAAGSSGGAAEIAATAAQSGMTPEQVVQAIQSAQGAAPMSFPSAPMTSFAPSAFNEDTGAVPASVQAAGMAPADLSPGKIALIAAAGLGLFLVMKPKGRSR